jgi:hypothetical protein
MGTAGDSEQHPGAGIHALVVRPARQTDTQPPLSPGCDPAVAGRDALRLAHVVVGDGPDACRGDTSVVDAMGG